jgi:chromosome transmission fidelity protein 1
VVIDEAHNLIDSILQLHSISITSSMLTSIRAALLTYLTKFKSRFTGANASYLKQLALVLKGLSEFADSWAKEGGGGAKGRKEEMVNVNKVTQGGIGGALDQINLLKLDEYLKKSRIARKVILHWIGLGAGPSLTPSSGTDWRLCRQSRRREDGKRCVPPSLSSFDVSTDDLRYPGRQAIRSNATRNLVRIQEFIVSLANAESDGRVLLTAEAVPISSSISGAPAQKGSWVEVTLKYMLLAPSEAFRDVAEEPKSVILAGGTMAPVRSAVRS